MADKRTVAVYDDQAETYASLTGSDAPDAHLQGFMDTLPDGGTVLDLGCGPARASAHMRDAGFEVIALDASPGMIALAREQNGIDAKLGTFDDIVEVETYDGIWANFSLLHAARNDLPRHLQALEMALKPSGVLHVGMKIGSGAARDRIDRLYTYVMVEELSGLLQDVGLQVTYTDTGEAKALSGEIDPFVIMRAVKHA